MGNPHILQRFLHSRADLLVSLCFALVSFVLIGLLYPSATPHNYYELLAKQLAQGRLCLPDPIPWLNELIPIEGLGYCVVYPITPALLFLPFIGVSIPLSQSTLSHLIFALTGPVVYLLALHHQHQRRDAFLFAIAFCYGTLFFSLSAVGSAWFIAQTIGAFCVFLAFLLYKQDSRWGLLGTGVALGLAATSRLPLHLYLPLFFWMIGKGKWKQWKQNSIAISIFLLGFLPLFLLQRGYNFARYDTFSDQGYYLIPGKFAEPDFAHGQFHLGNISKHLQVFLFAMPKTIDSFPFLVPSHYGLSIALTSPFLLLAVVLLVRRRMFPEFMTMLSILILAMSHGTVGFAQFGYRFALDVYPLLFLGLLREKISVRSRILLWVVVLFSIVVNTWGVLAFHYDWFVW